jgi:hypothetical protein
MDTKELDTIWDAMLILARNGHNDASAALGSILVKEAPNGWWSSDPPAKQAS